MNMANMNGIAGNHHTNLENFRHYNYENFKRNNLFSDIHVSNYQAFLYLKVFEIIIMILIIKKNLK